MNKSRLAWVAFGIFCFALVACDDVRTETFSDGSRLESHYVKDIKSGPERRFYPNGKLEVETPFVDGVAHGTQKAWFDNGKLRSEQTFDKGRLQGTALFYHPNGIVARKIQYSQGEEQGFPEEFDTWGKPTTHGEFKDSRDGRRYGWIRIGTQVWTAQNMSFAPVKGSLCLQCDNWGRLYDLAAANLACPKGFHLPSLQDWDLLRKQAGTRPAHALKSGWGWDPVSPSQEGNGSDSLGLGALSGGGHFAKSDVAMDKRIFRDAGRRAYFWSSEGKRIGFDYRNPNMLIEAAEPWQGFSVRCLLDDHGSRP